MNDHDLLLIAQLADGTIDAADESAARALLESSAAARAEYDAQVTAVAALRAAGPARLSPTERTALRESLVAQLGLEPPAEPAPLRRRRALPWGGLAVAAAALVGVVVLAPLLGVLSTGGGDAATDTIAGALDAPAPTEAPLATVAGDLEALPAEEQATLSQADDQDVPLGAPPAAAQTTVASGAGFSLEGLPYLGTIEASELPALESGLLSLAPPDAEQWRLSLFQRDGSTEAGPVLVDRLLAQDGCVTAVPPGFSGEAVALAEVSGTLAVIYRLQPDAGSGGPALLLVDLETCAELAATAGN